MKIIVVLLFCLFCLQSIRAQEVSIYGHRSLWHADNLCDVVFTGCDWLTLNQGYILGYAYHPNGELWLALVDFSGDYQKISLFDVQYNTCQYTLRYTITLPYYWSVVNAFNLDYLGRIYLRINEYDSVTNMSTRTLSRIADPANPTFERLFVAFPQQQVFEVHFSGDKVYIPETHKPIIYVYDTNFVIMDTIIMQKHIWGLTSLSYGCDSIITYAAHLDITTQDYVNNIKDTTMYISRFDLETGDLTPICNYWMGDNRANTQLTSPLEFLSSDPECDLLIDLDRDNSTGVYPYDYLDSTHYCTTLIVPICDPDVFIHTSAPLDSIVLIIAGIQEMGEEHLIAAGIPAGVTLMQRNDSTYVLTSNNPKDSIFQEALLALRYSHTGLQRTPGIRHIILQGFNAIKDGVKITAMINVAAMAYAGEDVNLLICTDTVINDMTTLTGGQLGGLWIPSLIGGGGVYNSILDLAPNYRYVIADAVCGNDTAEVTIHHDGSAPIDLLGPDRVLCAGDTIDLLIPQSASMFIWDDGSHAMTRQLTISGDYWVAMETQGGCVYVDSLHVYEGSDWSPDIIVTHPICGEADGQITIDSMAFEQNGTILINGVPMISPTLSLLSAGIYEVTTISNDGCEWGTSVMLTDQSVIDIAIDTQVIAIHGAWTTIDYTLNNNVDLSAIQFEPESSIRWNGTLIEVYGDRDITYHIIFVDENGCLYTHVLSVDVTEEEDAPNYFPNVFSPSSTHGNDIWQPAINDRYKMEVIRIYDRWGNMVYQSESDASWDGTIGGQQCQSGVYVYQITLTDIHTQEVKVLMGNIALLR